MRCAGSSHAFRVHPVVPASMSEPRIGRVLVASLHQAIADVLPMRLEFYENWLNAAGLREGTIGLAPLSAVLSFLRSEGDAYNQITTRAGEYAADWTVTNMPVFERRMTRLPELTRIRAIVDAVTERGSVSAGDLVAAFADCLDLNTVFALARHGHLAVDLDAAAGPGMGVRRGAGPFRRIGLAAGGDRS